MPPVYRPLRVCVTLIKAGKKEVIVDNSSVIISHFTRIFTSSNFERPIHVVEDAVARLLVFPENCYLLLLLDVWRCSADVLTTYQRAHSYVTTHDQLGFGFVVVRCSPVRVL